jgi:hypothetical protein
MSEAAPRRADLRKPLYFLRKGRFPAPIVSSAFLHAQSLTAIGVACLKSYSKC